VSDVVQSAASSNEFFGRAERAVVDSIGMDWSRVLLVDSNGNWKQETSIGKDMVPSHNLLDHVRHDRRTFWASPKTVKWGSVQPLRAVVAAPILNRAGDVIGALYGERRNQGGSVAEKEKCLGMADAGCKIVNSVMVNPVSGSHKVLSSPDAMVAYKVGDQEHYGSIAECGAVHGKVTGIIVKAPD
jgi:hypothetical protein